MESGKTPRRVAFLSCCQIVWQLNENHPRARNVSLKNFWLSVGSGPSLRSTPHQCWIVRKCGIKYFTCFICSNLTPFSKFSFNKKDHKYSIICAPNPRPPSIICISLSLEVDKRHKRCQNILVSAGVATSTMSETHETHQISNPHITSLTIRMLTTSPTASDSCNLKPTPFE